MTTGTVVVECALFVIGAGVGLHALYKTSWRFRLTLHNPGAAWRLWRNMRREGRDDV